jgi:hypothetical protein
MKISLNELLERRNAVRATVDKIRSHLSEVQLLVVSLEKKAETDLTKGLAEASSEAEAGK